MKPRLLDLFCGAGGAAMGYHRAGFEVVGVDINPQPHYPFEFVQRDALDYLHMFDDPEVLDAYGFSAIHASPPCQMFSAYRRARPGRGDEHYTNLIPDVRGLLRVTGLPYVIENVPRAPLLDPITLCGSSFGLDVRRHRLFESNIALLGLGCDHSWQTPRFDRGSRDIRPNDRRTVAVGEWRIPVVLQQSAMGIDWMTVAELSQAIPPAYTKWIGSQLLGAIEVAA